MSVRMKLSHSKTASRRAHHRAGLPHLVTTPTGVRRRHFLDPETGMYRGKQIILVGTKEVASKKGASTKRKGAKESDTSGKEKQIEAAAK